LQEGDLKQVIARRGIAWRAQNQFDFALSAWRQGTRARARPAVGQTARFNAKRGHFVGIAVLNVKAFGQLFSGAKIEVAGGSISSKHGKPPLKARQLLEALAPRRMGEQIEAEILRIAHHCAPAILNSALPRAAVILR
jgi:hypothetical protein